MRKEKNLDDNERHPQDEKGDDFPTGQSSQIMAEEKKSAKQIAEMIPGRVAPGILNSR